MYLQNKSRLTLLDFQNNRGCLIITLVLVTAHPQVYLVCSMVFLIVTGEVLMALGRIRFFFKCYINKVIIHKSS